MNQRPHLTNAPITEAVLDIQVQLPANARLGHLEAMHRDIRDRYPNRRTRHRLEVNIKLEGEMPIATPPKEDGYLFQSRDGKRIVQARLDGFSFNQLKPYDTWEALRDEAKQLWARYVDIARPEIVKRIALRYINRMDLPLPFTDFSDYVRIAPEIAPGIPQGVQNFFLRLEIPYPSGALAIVTETLQPPADPAQARTLPLILDIDVIRIEDSNAPFVDIWEKFEELRKIKNDIFFSTIKPRAEELFR
jgi:uncharacterized protein (TIGR04255 family)